MNAQKIKKDLSSLNSFAAKKRYCDKHFARLGSGSARVVYSISERRVLKLAKNIKGIAQNRCEENCSHHVDLVAKVHYSCDNDYFIIVDKAEKFLSKDFARKFNLRLKDFWDIVRQCYFPDRRDSKYHSFRDSNEEIVEGLEILLSSFGICSGDLTRPSSWGFVNGKIKIVDCGLNNFVFSEFYS